MRYSIKRTTPKVGVGWYTPQHWQLLKASAADKLDDTYDEWLANVSNTMNHLRTSGVDAVFVEVDIFELNRWLTANGLSNEGSSRARYVVEQLRDKEGRH